MSQFETPKGPSQLSQVKLRHGSMPNADQSVAAAYGSIHKEDGKSERKSEVRKKIVTQKASIASIGAGSLVDSCKLSSQKNYLEDNGGKGLVGMILSNSSKSDLKIEAG